MTAFEIVHEENIKMLTWTSTSLFASLPLAAFPAIYSIDVSGPSQEKVWGERLFLWACYNLFLAHVGGLSSKPPLIEAALSLSKFITQGVPYVVAKNQREKFAKVGIGQTSESEA